MSEEQKQGIVRHRMGTMLMTGLLEVIIEQLEVMVAETLPINAADPNVNLSSALGMAMDQSSYALGILRKRIEANPDQYKLPLPAPLPPLTQLEKTEPEPVWCPRCDNPTGACTCRRH